MPHGRVARGAKGQKIRSQWRWLKKIRKIRNIHFVVKNESNVLIYAKK